MVLISLSRFDSRQAQLTTAPIILPNQLELEAGTFQERADSMTEPDILSRKITELKEWQRVAWQRVADPLVTPFERREIRNHIRESDGELRRCLGIMSERLRFEHGAVEVVGDSLAKLDFKTFS
jgi:hypothetical protein